MTTRKTGRFNTILTSLSFLAGVIMIVVAAPWFIFDDNIKGAITIAVVGLVAVLVGRLHLVDEFALGPLKARLRASIDEANATILQLRAVALALGEASLTDLMAGNFAGGMSLRERLAARDVIVKSLIDVGLSKGEIEKASANWNKGMALTYHRAIGDRLAKGLDNPEVWKGYQALINFSEWHTASPNQIQAFLTKHNLITPELSEWIADYRHFVETKEIRRRDKFVDGADT